MAEKWAEYVRDHRRGDTAAYGPEMDAFVKGPIPEGFVKRNKKNKDGVPRDRTKGSTGESGEQAGGRWSSSGYVLPWSKKGKPLTNKDVIKGIDHSLARHLERLNKIKNRAHQVRQSANERYADGRIYAGGTVRG